MNLPTIVEIILFNTATATLLALVAAMVERLARRPGIAHALWALVLLKLLFPPVIEMAVVPRGAVKPRTSVTRATTWPASGLAADVAVAATPQGAPAPLEAAAAALPARAAVPWTSLVLVTWAAGSLVLVGLTCVRARRFRRWIAGGRPAPPALERVARALARGMGVRCPALRIVAARVSPMLWCPGRRPMLLFPAALLTALDGGERDALLVHELAHLGRRDHLLRYVELLAMIAFWWHPGVWWARRRLRRLEEQSCDAVVLEALPGQGGPYARGLVKTIEFLAGGPARVPALASGAARNGAARHLEERLTMILNDTTPGRLSRTQRTFLAALAAGALLIVPSWAEPSDATEPREATESRDAANEDATVDNEYRQRLRDVELEALELERSIRDLEGRRRAIELERLRLERERQVAILRGKAEAAEREGRAAEADFLRRQADQVEDRAFHEHESQRIESEQVQLARELKLTLRRERIEAAETATTGDTARAEDLRRDRFELQEQLQQLRRELAELGHASTAIDATRAEALARAEFERAIELQRAAALDYEAEFDRAAEFERAIELELQQRSADERMDRRAQLIAQLKELHAEARRLEETGAQEEADALWRDIQLLKVRLAVLENEERVH